MTGPALFYVRHGQTDWNAELRFQGRRDIPLNDHGREQARENGRKLNAQLGKAEDHTFISSPLSRARETMELIRAEMALPVGEYQTDDRLLEVSYGELEGTTQAEMKARDRELYYFRKQNAWEFRPENGESQADVLKRVADWHASLDPQKKYIVTAHGAIGRVLRHYLAGISTDDVARYAFPQDKIFLFHDGTEQLF